MSWTLDETGKHGHYIVWEDEDGVGMTLGEPASLRESEPSLNEIYRALYEVKTEKDSRGFFWETRKDATVALRLVKAIDKAVKAKKPLICPCCKRPLDNNTRATEEPGRMKGKKK